jgi:hypothetical protein
VVDWLIKIWAKLEVGKRGRKVIHRRIKIIGESERGKGEREVVDGDVKVGSC